MKVIGIEIDNVIRNRNKQIAKYYAKDIDKTVDVDTIETGVTDASLLLFKSKKERQKFLYEDYSYEIYGCAKAMSKETVSKLNEWIIELNDMAEPFEVVLFSTMECDLTIQSTYFFLAKSACRARNIYFPHDTKDIWKKCDIVIGASKSVLDSKPYGKVSVGISTKDNAKSVEKSDFAYENLKNAIEDGAFLKKVVEKSKLYAIFYKIKKMFK